MMWRWQGAAPRVWLQILFIGVSILVLMIGVDSSPTHFSVRIRGHFR
jgi:hypothetical protein